MVVMAIPSTPLKYNAVVPTNPGPAKAPPCIVSEPRPNLHPPDFNGVASRLESAVVIAPAPETSSPLLPLSLDPTFECPNRPKFQYATALSWRKDATLSESSPFARTPHSFNVR